ncbi:MAG: cytochrome P460 family protein [Kofleriaceae bacterium]|nr:cytochrome P460 family protein [Kofleriaceae bacterium]
MHTNTIQAVLSTPLLLLLFSCGDAPKNNAKTSQDNPAVDIATRQVVVPRYSITADKTLNRPTGYREWVYVGMPVTPNELNNGKAAFPEMHSVYINPEAYRDYQRSGKFPDGTILVKELLSVGATSASSGNGYFMGDFVGLEATIKSTEHFPDEPGNWAYYSFTNKNGGALTSTAKPFPTASCNACHDASADDDFVFTQHYPVLRDARNEELAIPGQPLFSIDDGVLKRPRGYRSWVFVGGPLTPNELNKGKAAFPEFHNVYIDNESYAHLQKTGKFRDGTILIKELVSVGATSAVSGSGFFMGDFIGLEATIKSSKHFPDEPGNWAYYSFTSEDGAPLKKSANAFPTASCNGCHNANAAEDFVFTQYYPILRDALASAAGSPLKTDNQWQPIAAHPKAVAGMPLARRDLHAWLKSGKYQSFPAKNTKTHPGRGPHTQVKLPVKVFYNKILSKSVTNGARQHPKGAIAVKEMYDTSGALAGWAVMAKISDTSDAGKNWFWYEVTSTTDNGAVPAAGTGIPGCIGCHNVGGTDLILSGSPLL